MERLPLRVTAFFGRRTAISHFKATKEGVGTTAERANAMSIGGNLTLAAEAGQSIYFYDPVKVGGTSTSRTININDRPVRWSLTARFMTVLLTD